MQDKIFVSIASYRDYETNPTIKDLINKAKNPDSISIGLCLQHDQNEIVIDTKYNKYIKLLEYNWRESQGTCWARHQIQNLMSDEKYYLQLDSHHRFCEYWDEQLIDIHNELLDHTDKPIIGGYCPGYEPDNDLVLEDKPMQINSFSDFTDLGDLPFIPKTIRNFQELQKNKKNFIPARFLSGHFIFSDSYFCTECPYDPNMYFRGEELSLSARAYTSGYNFFHATKPIVWHEYIRKNKTKHWDDHTTRNGFLTTWNARSDKGKARARYLLGIEKKKMNFGKYGLGNKRSLHEYELYSGLRFETKQVHKYTYDINNVYPYASILDENEWVSGLMTKYNVNMEIPENVLYSIREIENLKYISVICDSKQGCCYRKDIQNYDLHQLVTNYTIVASMDGQPNSIRIVPYANKQGFLNGHNISNFRVTKAAIK